MSIESCGICGGDGRIANSFGNQTRCPSCHGTGRRSDEGGLRDVTKTKASHYSKQGMNKAPVAVKQTWPRSVGGDTLANEVKACAGLTDEVKARITREIIDHESTHGNCTQTFMRKVRKQLRATV
jgi:RecJ-like exonuclease